MTAKLKKRFIIFSMASVTCLLMFIVFAINGLNWFMTEYQSDEMLESLLDNNNRFTISDKDIKPPDMPDMGKRDPRLRANMFFTAVFDSDGSIVQIDTMQAPSLESNTAEKYASSVYSSGKLSGRMDGYKYAVKTVDSNTVIAFMDISGQSNMLLMVLLVSCGIGVLCWVVLLVIVILLSGKVIRPVTYGIEKQKQFITNAGHEMKTPLAIIQSNNDTMALIHGENKYNINIRNQTKRLNDLMSNMLILSRLDEEVTFASEKLDISELIRDMLPAYTEQAKNKNIEFDTHIDDDIVLNINKAGFCQMITALFDNAVKYTPEHGRISIDVKMQGKRVQITEENTCDGADIEPDPERLFERFYRGDSARTQSSGTSGYGIGLSAARAICESFGGKLKAEYTDGNSIRFIAVF